MEKIQGILEIDEKDYIISRNNTKNTTTRNSLDFCWKKANLIQFEYVEYLCMLVCLFTVPT